MTVLQNSVNYGSEKMTCQQAIDYLYSRLKFGSIPGLERIEALCNKLGDPQDKLKFIHVAGTNGKGSTCSMIASMLQKAGYRVGLFTSPYVVDFRERIQINGEMIKADELGNIVDDVRPFVEHLDAEGITATEFEVLTAVAFLYFYRKSCDYVVLEVGLGGLCDSTNVIKSPELCVITSVSYDHTHILGNTIQEIAYQKAGIIKENSSVVVYPQVYSEAESIILNTAYDKNCKIYQADKNQINLNKSNISGSVFDYKGVSLKTRLVGHHQILNAATAYESGLALIDKGVDLSLQDIIYGIENAFIAARTQIVSEKPLVVVDGGHNPDGITALCKNIKTIFSHKKIVAIIGMMSDKDVSASAEMLAPLCKKIITVTVDNPRSMSGKELSDIYSKFCTDVTFADNIKDIYYDAVSSIQDDEMLLVCGSLYLASEVENIKNQL